MSLKGNCLPELCFLRSEVFFLRSEWNLINKINSNNKKTAYPKRDAVIIKYLFLCWLIVFKPILHLLYFRSLGINNVLS